MKWLYIPNIALVEDLFKFITPLWKIMNVAIRIKRFNIFCCCCLKIRNKQTINGSQNKECEKRGKKN